MVKAPPNCKNSTPKDQWVVQQWNAMFSIGGPACLITTVEGNTGLRMDHFAVVDFRGFRAMVDALGGVPICTPEAIDDPKAKLSSSAGRHVLDGTQALGYVRARKTLGDGSDLGRIERQQAFLSSVVQEATRTSLLARPDKLFGFLDAATKSLTTDEQFGLGTMKEPRAERQGHRHQERPVHHRPRAGLPGRPQPRGVGARRDVLWQTLRDDGVVGEKPSTVRRHEHPVDREPDADSRRRRQRHRGAGLAAQVAAALAVQGFPKPTTSSTAERPNGVVVEYGPGQAEAATVAAAFEGATLRESSAVTSGVRVVLARGGPVQEIQPHRFLAGASPSVSAPAPSPSPSITARTADQDTVPDRSVPVR